MKSRIKELLKERGMTMAELASIIGTTQTSISRMLGENGNPTYDTLMKVAEALKVGMSDLFINDSNTITCPRCGAKFDFRKEEEQTMDQLTFTFSVGLILAIAFLVFLYTKAGQKWLDNL